MAPKTDAEKAAKLREMAKDKSLPQPVRNQYLDDANKLEEKAATKAGVKLAKGGMAKQTPMLPRAMVTSSNANQRAKMAASTVAFDKHLKTVANPYGDSTVSPRRTQASIDEYLKAVPTRKPAPKRPQRAGQSSAESTDLGGAMAKGGAVVAKAPKKMMYGGAVAKPMADKTSGKTMMAKGGAAKKAKK
jgi:hypothetical protein